MELIRQPAVAGRFYPSDPLSLESAIQEFLNRVPTTVQYDNVKAIIVPHASHVCSGQVAAYAYKVLQNNKKKKIILIGPAHTVYFDGFVSDDSDYWATPLGSVKVMKNDFIKNSSPHREEHCLEVQLPFLQMVLDDFEVLPIVVGGCDPKILSKKVIDIYDDETMVVISSDLSHFNDYDTAVEFDTVTNKAIENLDYDTITIEGDACGKIPLLAVVDMANYFGWKCKMLEYKNSGDVLGYRSHVVGYSSFVIKE